MIVSEARIEANRRNAQLSNGPRTEAGKERSRRNALADGLSAEVVRLPEDDAALGAVAVPEAGPPAPALDWQGWLVGEVAVIATQLRRCDRLEGQYRGRIALRAEFHWDDDRRLEAESLGSRIARDPAGVARSLRMSPQGCDWLIERWSLLARAADRDGAWTPEQTALAFDLLGTPRDFRAGPPGDPIDLEATTPADFGPADFGPAALARREVAALLARKAETARADAFDRCLAQSDAIDEADADLRRLRRHETDLHRRLRWCVVQIQKAPPAPSPKPAPDPIPPPPPRPEPRPEPAEEPGIDVDLIRRFEAIMAQADAPRAPVPATPRPDPRAAREKARKADRQRKRDRRRA